MLALVKPCPMQGRLQHTEQTPQWFNILEDDTEIGSSMLPYHSNKLFKTCWSLYAAYCSLI
uniref:Uncharacterized protein n=1 Tax=Arundo donax TaxID=35708 RepID=A0A0A9GWJ7_ARUDO